MSDYDPTCPDDVAPREWRRIRALEADLADSRLIAREQEDAHVAANMRYSAELALRQTAEAYAARNALRVIEVEAALRDLLDDLSEDVGQRHHRDKYRVYQVGPQTIEAARALLPALETACTCDSTLVTDISNHQPHCPRYVAETKRKEMQMKGDLFMHVLSGQPAQFDPYTGQISIGHKKIKRLCASMNQVRRERRASMKFYRESDARLYSLVRIPASALNRGSVT